MIQTSQERFVEYITRQTSIGYVSFRQTGVLVVLCVMMWQALRSSPPALAGVLLLITLGWFAATARSRKVRRNNRVGLERVRRVVRNSVSVTTQLVQANTNIFSPGSGNFPCLVLMTFDMEAVHNPDFLPDLAERLFTLKDTEQTTPDLREAAKFTTDERAHHYRRRRVPLSMTGGVIVYICDLLLFRSRLREGFLTQRRLPCFAETGEAGGLELVPYWIADGELEPVRHRSGKGPDAYKVTPRRP